MVQTQKVVEQLGYTPNEAKVYIAALGLGECHISDLAHKLKLPPSSVQVIVDKLHKNGLMNFYVKNRYKYWVAENPERLLAQLEQREAAVRGAMPALSALRKTSGQKGKTAVKVFTGRDEIKYIFDDIINAKHHVLGIMPDVLLDLFEETSILEDFIESRTQHFLRMRVLASDTPTGRTLAASGGTALREVRFLPERIDIRTATLIYADKVALVMLNQKQPTALLIEDAGLRDTNTALFEQLWSLSGPTDEAPSQAETLFRALADGSPQPLLITNDKTEIEYVNAAWEEHLGYTLEEVRGKFPQLLQSGTTPRDVYDRMWKALHAGEHFQSDEIIDKKKSGEHFNLLTTIFPMRSGSRLFYVQLLTDITTQKRAEETKQNFLKTAVAYIRPALARLELLPQLLKKTEQKGIGETMEEELSKLDNLTKKLLDDASS